jgi:large subunit ribosomal protein L18
MAKRTRSESRIMRHERLRRHLRGSAERPRLAIFRSLRHISAQLIDDDLGVTIVSATSQGKGSYGGNIAAAAKVGEDIAKKAKEKGVVAVVFDRGGFRYAGRVAALAEGARKGGLAF